jgi:hypothetical protein
VFEAFLYKCTVVETSDVFHINFLVNNVKGAKMIVKHYSMDFLRCFITILLIIVFMQNAPVSASGR